MLLSTIFSMLSTGHLRQLSVGGNSDGGIQQIDYETLTNAINLGIIELYKRYDINSLSEDIVLVANTYIYTITATNSINIYSIQNENEEELLYNEDESVILTGSNSFKVSEPVDGDIYTVSYNTYPDLIDNISLDPATVTVALPNGLIEPLLFYVASQVYIPINSDESNRFYNYYINSLNNIDILGTITKQHYGNQRLDLNGFK